MSLARLCPRLQRERSWRLYAPESKSRGIKGVRLINNLRYQKGLPGVRVPGEPLYKCPLMHQDGKWGGHFPF
jgi:hypothetical protein